MLQLKPQTLNTIRLSQALSLSKLSALCGISTAILSRIEQGQRPAKESEITALSQSLSVSSSALCKTLVSQRFGLSSFYHRKLASAPSKNVNAIQSHCLLGATAVHQLLDLSSLDLPDYKNIIDIDDLDNDVAKIANVLRLAWQLPRGPIQDLCKVIEDHGCVIVHKKFNVSKIDALYQKAPNMPPIFWVNSSKPLDRVRFSLAHELGHLILHEQCPKDEKQAEVEADEFAANFLMPRSDFRSELPSRLNMPQLIALKSRWRCSMSAMMMRARQINRIDDRQYKNLMIQLSKNGWRKHEPNPISGESPQLLAKLIQNCLSTSQLTITGLAELISFPANQLQDWLQPIPQFASHKDDSPKLRYIAA